MFNSLKGRSLSNTFLAYHQTVVS